MTTRRNFLKSLGAFAALSFIPPVKESIARAPDWAKRVVVYRAQDPLPAGNHTFTAYSGSMGLYLAGVTCVGGETLFEVPYSELMLDPKIKLNDGIRLSYKDTFGMCFADRKVFEELQRGRCVFEEPLRRRDKSLR